MREAFFDVCERLKGKDELSRESAIKELSLLDTPPAPPGKEKNPPKPPLPFFLKASPRSLYVYFDYTLVPKDVAGVASAIKKRDSAVVLA